jgi:antitoxin (DNA-binding transcriptional repressor) of toxin-antitoxin stability system
MEPKETMAISKFKATCLAVLERVRRTGEPVRITRFGKAVADIVPPSAPASAETWIGSLRGRARIAGDLIAPVVDPEEWDVVQNPTGSKRGRRRSPSKQKPVVKRRRG